RLGDVVVGAELERQHLVALLAAGGEREHGHGPPLLAQGAQDVQAVAVGEHHVEHDEVGVPGAREVEAAPRGLGDVDGVALELEVCAQAGAEVAVFDDEDAGHAGTSAVGKWTTKRAPPPSRSSTRHVPPWRATSSRTRARPMPAPVAADWRSRS